MSAWSSHVNSCLPVKSNHAAAQKYGCEIHYNFVYYTIKDIGDAKTAKRKRLFLSERRSYIVLCALYHVDCDDFNATIISEYQNLRMSEYHIRISGLTQSTGTQSAMSSWRSHVQSRQSRPDTPSHAQSRPVTRWASTGLGKPPPQY